VVVVAVVLLSVAFVMQGRSVKKHLKRLTAPKHWMLDKMGGAWAPRPSEGPHKLRECLPIIVILRNRLKYALNRREVVMISMQKLVQVDGKIRTDPNFPAGLMDVVTLGPHGAAATDNSIDRFRLMYDVKGRFVLHKIDAQEANYKLCKVVKQELTSKAVPYIVTHDGRTIRYHDPSIKRNDTVLIDIRDGKVVDTLKMQLGHKVIVTKGKNRGRYGTLVNVEKHPGSFDIVTVKDADNNSFATRFENIFVFGKAEGEKLAITKKDGTALISMPKGRGVAQTILQEQQKRLSQEEQHKRHQ
jgi:small subunit ribosomal protein S4e